MLFKPSVPACTSVESVDKAASWTMQSSGRSKLAATEKSLVGIHGYELVPDQTTKTEDRLRRISSNL